MIYECNICNYTTNRKSNYDNHCNSKRHEKMCINEQLKQEKTTLNEAKRSLNHDFFCDFCNLSFKKNYLLSRHLRICTPKRFKSESDKLQTQIESLIDKNRALETEVKFLRNVVTSAGSLMHESMSAINFLSKSYKNTPLLENLDSTAKIKSIVELNDNSSDDFIERLSYEYRQKTLPKFLGKFFIDNYKKKNPEEQSIWNSDATRLTYIIRVMVNDEHNWDIDKKGKKVKTRIIDPVLKYLKDTINEFIENINSSYVNSLKGSDKTRFIDKLEGSSKIIKEIDEGNLANDILKFITPYFYIKK